MSRLPKYSCKAVLLLLIFALSACSSTNIGRSSGKKPGWVRERPVNDAYYTGIGVASTSQANYMKVAKNNALTDLTSEISVKISGNSVLHQLEDETGFREEFESFTRTSLRDQLEGYELADSYTDKDNYWVYYRLSKEKYQRIKREKLERSKQLAKGFYEKGLAAESSYKIHQALNYYVKAFEAIKPHFDEDLSVFVLNRGRINLGNALYESIQELFSSIRVQPDQEVFRIRALSGDNDPVTATVYYQDNGNRQPVEDLPFTFSLPDLKIEQTESVQSNASGNITCNIAEMAPKGKQQRIKATLNTDVYFGENSEGNILPRLFDAEGSLPFGYLTVQVRELQAYFEAQEQSFGRSGSSHPVTDIFRQALTKNFFSLVEDRSKADVVIQVEANTSKGKFMEQYNLYTAYLSCNISVFNANKQTKVYSTGLHNIKGMKTGGYDMAARDAQSKAKEQIQQKIIPELRTIKF